MSNNKSAEHPMAHPPSNEAMSQSAKPAPIQTIRVKLLRAYWAEDHVRSEEGAMLELPEKEAKRLINAGVATFE